MPIMGLITLRLKTSKTTGNENNFDFDDEQPESLD